MSAGKVRLQRRNSTNNGRPTVLPGLLLPEPKSLPPPPPNPPEFYHGRVDLEYILRTAGETDVKKVYEISIPEWSLKQVENLAQFRYLRVLDLSFNQLSQIQGLEALSELRELRLSHNSISTIAGLSKLRRLSVLQLQGNSLTSIGDGLQGLKLLETLRLDDNKLEEIKVRDICGCSGLTSLSLAGNQLSDVSAVTQLPNLADLNVSFNKISKLPDLSRCSKLTELDCSANTISSLPQLPTRLQLLHADQNDLALLGTLPAGLTHLSICRNLFTTLDPSLPPRLEILHAAENSLADLEKLLTLLQTLPALVELKLVPNPFRDGLNTARIIEVLPKLEILDSVPLHTKVAAPATPRTATPMRPQTATLMRPQTANTALSTAHVSRQLTAMRTQLVTFQEDWERRFREMRESLHQLPAAPPSRPGTAAGCLESGSASSSRPTSRCSARSRIESARVFAPAASTKPPS